MDLTKIAQDYLQTTNQHRELEHKLQQVFQLWGPDNELWDIKGPAYTAYESLVAELLGQELMDWVLYWQWDCDGGTNGTLKLGTNSHNIADLDFEEFFKLIQGYKQALYHNLQIDILA